MPVTFEKFIEGDVVYALQGYYGNESGSLSVDRLYGLSVIKGTVQFYYKDNDTFYYVMIKDSNGEYIKVPYRLVEHRYEALKGTINIYIECTVNELKRDIEECEKFLKTI